jgi:hypothetical protein
MDAPWIPDDLTRVTLDDPQAVEYWTKALGATEQDLRAALQNVGTNAESVRTFLRRKDPMPPEITG